MESPISGRSLSSEWKPGPAAENRYCNNSTATSFVWFFIHDRQPGEGLEVVLPNIIAMAVIGGDAGILHPETDAVKRWAVYAREHEGRGVTVSPAAFRKLVSRDISRIPVPPGLAGAGALSRDFFVQTHFEKTLSGRIIPRKYSFVNNEALVFIRFCIIHDLDLRTDCETGRLFLLVP